MTPKSMTQKSCTILATKAVLNAVKKTSIFSYDIYTKLTKKPLNLPRRVVES